jgi:hypothetical protein
MTALCGIQYLEFDPTITEHQVQVLKLLIKYFLSEAALKVN